MTPTRDQMLKASHDLFYEYRMLLYAASVIGAGTEAGCPMGNCLLESFLIHLRNLVDFLSTTPVKDDCSAQHFVSPEEWDGLRERFSDSLRTARDRMNKRLAHLTYSRGDQENYPNAWPISDIAVEIIEVMTSFLDMAEARLGDEWSSQETRKKLMDLEAMAVVGSDLVGSA